MTKDELKSALDDSITEQCTFFWHRTPENGDENYMQHTSTFCAGTLFFSNIIKDELEKGNDIRITLDLLTEIYSVRPIPQD